MKKLLILLILSIFSTSVCFSQWLWSKQIGSNAFYFPYDNVRSLTCDGSYLYMSGVYGHQLYTQGDTLFCNGNNDIFIMKLDLFGNQIWAKTLGGNFNQPSAIEDAYMEYDSICNCIYVAGSIIGNVDFGNGINLQASASNADIFLAKMDLSGSFLWATTFGGIGDDGTQIFKQPDGHILLAGNLENATIIDGNTVNPGGFLASFDTNGSCMWASHKFSGPEVADLAIDFVGNDIVMGGGYNISNGYIDTVSLPPAISFDGFITRMDSIGNVKWVTTFGNNGIDAISSLFVDQDKNLYFAGSFKDSINIFNNSLLSNGQNALLGKIDENKNPIWVNIMPCTGSYAGGSEIEITQNGNLFLAGSFSSTITFDQFNYSTTNSNDMFVSKFDTSGNFIGVQHFGQASSQEMIIGANGRPIIAGIFANSITIGNNSYTSYGYNDIFLAQCDDITGLEEPERFTSNQLIIYANPNIGKCNITVPDEFVNEKYLELTIFDNSGKTVQKKILEMNDGVIKVDLEAQAMGVYSITLGNGKKVYSGKMVIE